MTCVRRISNGNCRSTNQHKLAVEPLSQDNDRDFHEQTGGVVGSDTSQDSEPSERLQQLLAPKIYSLAKDTRKTLRYLGSKKGWQVNCWEQVRKDEERMVLIFEIGHSMIWSFAAICNFLKWRSINGNFLSILSYPKPLILAIKHFPYHTELASPRYLREISDWPSKLQLQVRWKPLKTWIYHLVIYPLGA